MNKKHVYQAAEMIATGQHEFCCLALCRASGQWQYKNSSTALGELADSFQEFYGFPNEKGSMSTQIYSESHPEEEVGWRVLLLLLFAEVGGKL